MRRYLWIAASSLVVLLWLSASASAAPTSSNGRLVFVRFRCGETSCKWRIVTATPRDRDEHVLAWFPDGAFDDHFIVNPSPDGRLLAFMAYQKIWVMNSDGSNRHAVFTPPNDGSGVDDGPSFTPDGHHLVFVRCCPQPFGYSLWMINTNGTHLRDITRDRFADTTPQVSPDGRLVAFNRCRDNGCQIAVANLRTGHIRNLVRFGMDTQQPNWSPDGKRIVFEYHPTGGTINIATINRRGGDLHKLTRSTTVYYLDASYSADGRWIIFDRFPGTNQTLDLYRMRPNGRNIQAITRTPIGNELEPKSMAAG